MKFFNEVIMQGKEYNGEFWLAVTIGLTLALFLYFALVGATL